MVPPFFGTVDLLEMNICLVDLSCVNDVFQADSDVPDSAAVMTSGPSSRFDRSRIATASFSAAVSVPSASLARPLATGGPAFAPDPLLTCCPARRRRRVERHSHEPKALIAKRCRDHNPSVTAPEARTLGRERARTLGRERGDRARSSNPGT
jgi:hypothetical protein